MVKDTHPFEQAHSIGPKMVRLLESIGVTTFEQLENADAHELALRINVEMGGKHLNSMGVGALENLIEFADGQKNGI